MITKTILTQTELLNEGHVVISHFILVVYDDNGVEIARGKSPHTVTLAPDADRQQILDAVNADITTREGMGWPAIEQADWDRVTGYCDIEHTPEVKAAYADFIATQQAKIAKEK